MREYLVAKLAHTVVVAACVLTLVFVVLHMTGDPVMMLLPPNPSREEVEALTRALGLDQPLHVQYFRFVQKLLRGDFGTSLQHQQPAMRLVMERLPASMLLAVTALVLAVLLSVPLGIAAARAAGHAGRPARGRARRPRPVRADLLDGPHADARLLGHAEAAPDHRLRHVAAPDHARPDAGQLPDGGDGAARALGHARGARRRLRPDRAGQGAPRAPRRPEARPQERRDAHRDRHRAPVRARCSAGRSSAR